MHCAGSAGPISSNEILEGRFTTEDTETKRRRQNRGWTRVDADEEGMRGRTFFIRVHRRLSAVLILSILGWLRRDAESSSGLRMEIATATNAAVRFDPSKPVRSAWIAAEHGPPRQLLRQRGDRELLQSHTLFFV